MKRISLSLLFALVAIMTMAQAKYVFYFILLVMVWDLTNSWLLQYRFLQLVWVQNDSRAGMIIAKLHHSSTKLPASN